MHNSIQDIVTEIGSKQLNTKKEKGGKKGRKTGTV